MPPLTNHHVLILGGTSGIGFAIANLVLATDSTITLTIASSNLTRIQSALAKLHSSFPSQTAQITGHEIDLSSPKIEENLTSLLDTITKQKSHLLDHIISTAGRPPATKPLVDTNIVEILNQTQWYLAAPLTIGKIAAGYMKASYSSSITFTGGRLADRPLVNYEVFSMYTAGLQGLVRGLALGVKPLRVNLVSPGATMTEMWGPEEVREMIAKKVGETALLGKVGSAEEVAEGYIYLMRDWNATGSIVRSDGGALLQ